MNPTAYEGYNGSMMSTYHHSLNLQSKRASAFVFANLKILKMVPSFFVELEDVRQAELAEFFRFGICAGRVLPENPFLHQFVYDPVDVNVPALQRSAGPIDITIQRFISLYGFQQPHHG